ncbi:Flp family type IVb pilin [Alphaproteobacteria bacterium KMM 3653]|uniref:Flp family type IVb pilin n=1 Tax=Harenicola maris TaxID=2841044 RepID=A0AAP2G454_9RHOB|nr:Flp family type IVb pilin [Harenicola maris]
MKTQLKALFARFRDCDEGATLVEYGIALGLAIGVGTLAISTLSSDVTAEFTSASTVLKANDG